MPRLKVSTTTVIALGVLMGAAVLCRPLLAGAGAAPLVSKNIALESIARRVLAPGYADLTEKSVALSTATDLLVANPNARTLASAQQAWKQVLLAWRRTQPFAHGPVQDLGVYSRIQFWPSRRQSVERVLQTDRPIDGGYINELGANAIGLSALELLLFDGSQGGRAQLAALTGTAGERRRRYAQALAKELVAETRSVSHAWQGPAGYAATFGKGGQQQLNLLVNDLLETIEAGTEARLRTVIERHAEREFRTNLLEGGLSGTSQQGLLTLLVAARSTFSGGDGIGVDDYLKELNAPTAQRVEVQFQKAIAAVQALSFPLDEAMVAQPQAVRRAHEECRALEILLKVEVASSLGVTLTFKAIDGD